MRALKIPSVEEAKVQNTEYERKQKECIELQQKYKIEKAFNDRAHSPKLITLQLDQPLLPHFKTYLEKLGYSVTHDYDYNERYFYEITFE
jgi:hypothetical protein